MYLGSLFQNTANDERSHSAHTVWPLCQTVEREPRKAPDYSTLDYYSTHIRVYHVEREHVCVREREWHAVGNLVVDRYSIAREETNLDTSARTAYCGSR